MTTEPPVESKKRLDRRQMGALLATVVVVGVVSAAGLMNREQSPMEQYRSQCNEDIQAREDGRTADEIDRGCWLGWVYSQCNEFYADRGEGYCMGSERIPEPFRDWGEPWDPPE